MACRWCGEPCGEREFCDEVCYDAHVKAWEEYQRWSADEPDPPQNEWCGSRGNNF
jgi:hypothetical protein